MAEVKLVRLEISLMRGVSIATGWSVCSPSLLPDVFMLHVCIPPKREISATPDTTCFVFAFGSSTSCVLGRMSLLLILFFILQLFVFWMPHVHLHTSLLLWLLNYSHNYLKCLYVVSGYAITFAKYLYTVIHYTVLIC